MVSMLFKICIHYLTSLTDSVIWIGDFNYRIGLNSDKVKQLIKMNDLETLYENDQVWILKPCDGRKSDISHS
jgi:hypothetical protein